MEIGEKVRNRTCKSPILDETVNCNGTDIDIKPSYNYHCPPVNGSWSGWSNYNEYFKSCGGGIQHKTILCNNPEPQYGVLDCIGDSIEVQNCSNYDYPGINYNLLDSFFM